MIVDEGPHSLVFATCIRLAGSVLAEWKDERAVASRRYVSVESIAKALIEATEEPGR